MYNHLSSLVPLSKRAMMHMSGSMGGSNDMGMMGDNDGTHERTMLPIWYLFAVFGLAILFLPLVLYLTYTLNNLLPMLAMIEDPSPPVYEPLSNNPDDAEAAHAGSASPAPVTASIRQTSRMLRSISGFPSLFRGIWCAIVASFTMSAAESFVGIFLPGFLVQLVAPLPAILITLPLTTAWTHIVMSAPKSAAWWRRLPPSRKTFAALWRPAVILWLAFSISISVPTGVSHLLNIRQNDKNGQVDVGGLAWKSTVAGLIGLILGLGLVVPAHVIFIRVQASLLPVEDEPIIPFDRSFGGNVEPEVVGGKGYASVSDAWKTFSRENWVRLLKLYFKVIAISLVGLLVMAACFASIWFVALKHARHETIGEN